MIARGAAREGLPAEVEWAPGGRGGYLFSRIATAPAGDRARVTARYLPESRQLVLEGTVAAGVIDTLAFAQRDPVRLAAAELADALARAGIRVAGGWRVRWEATSDPQTPVATAGGAGCGGPPATGGCHPRAPLASIESPPLAEIVAGVLGPSQNWMAEQLVRTLGAELGEEGSLDEGLREVREFLAEEVGIDTLDIRPRDGAGLSAYNLVTPRALVSVLRHMRARSDGEAYRRAMAEPGEPDSTLEDRLAGLEGRVFAKTGSISNVNTLSGYLVREDGQEIVFAILSNATGVGADEVRAAIDEVVRALAR